MEKCVINYNVLYNSVWCLLLYNKISQTLRCKVPMIYYYLSWFWRLTRLIKVVLAWISHIVSVRYCQNCSHLKDFLTIMSDESCWLLVRTSAGIVSWNTYTWPLHVSGASQHGDWVLRASTPKRKSQVEAILSFIIEPGRSHRITSAILYWLRQSQDSTKFKGRDVDNTSRWKSNKVTYKSHIKKTCGMKDVMTIFGKYNLQQSRW